MDVARLSQLNEYGRPLTLALPPGYLGVHFSKTVPTEICRIDEESPLFDASLQFMGRLAFHLSIPNKIDIYGALDNVTLEAILTAYHNIPDRKLVFKNRGESSDRGIITTTVLPIGPIHATFRSTKGFFRSKDRVCVEQVSNTILGSSANYEFPVGHFVQKVIIPNQLVLEGGIRSPEALYQTLSRYSDVPNRKIVFQKGIPGGGLVTKVTLPKGTHGILFYADFQAAPGLPVVSAVVGYAKWQQSIPVDHIVSKLIIPNVITMERMTSDGVEKTLNDFSEVADRILVLQEFHRDISKAGAKITITLPTGKLGLILKSYRDRIWVAKVKPDSQLVSRIPSGYFVESLVIPGELELIGKEEMGCATYLSQKLGEFSHVSNRVLVLKQYKKDVQKRQSGTRFQNEFV